jgi:nickel-dependent lactate racemase
VSLPYGGAEVEVDIPVDRVEGVDVLALADRSSAADPRAVIEHALGSPVASPRLSDLAAEVQDAVIVVDDVTRPTPVSVVLPAVIDELVGGGVPREAITVLVALGTHRLMTGPELRARLGDEPARTLRVVQHDYRDASSLIDLGATESGIPVVVNHLVCESQLTVTIGNIVPHRYCGWAGGAKMILPGVSGADSTAATHLMITKDPNIRLGVVENRARHEIEAVADLTSLRFVVNTVLTRSGGIYDVVAGDFRAAFRHGVERALDVYSVPVRRLADIVLVAGYPSEINFWQAGKALYAAELLVRDGGTIVLAAPCPEGMGEHDEFIDLLAESYEAIEARLTNGEVRDRIGGAAALAVAVVRRKARLFLVADGVSDAEARRAALPKFASLQHALARALTVAPSSAKPTLAVLREGAEALPVLST